MLKPKTDGTVESHPFDSAQGRLFRKCAEGWGTRSASKDEIELPAFFTTFTTGGTEDTGESGVQQVGRALHFGHGDCWMES